MNKPAPYAFIFLISFFCLKMEGQTYNKLITDKEYNEFITKDIFRDSIRSIHHILKTRYPLIADHFFFKDSVDYETKNSYQNLNFIFRRLNYENKILTNSLDTIFSRKDIDFFGA